MTGPAEPDDLTPDVLLFACIALTASSVHRNIGPALFTDLIVFIVPTGPRIPVPRLK